MKILGYACIATMLFSGCSGINKGSYDLHKTLALIIILVIIALFFALAIYSNMLRDEVNDCDAFDAEVEKKRHKGRYRLVKPENPFSLSRTQFAVWTVIIGCSFIYLALCITGCEMSQIPISPTALALMGIGATVTTASTLIDKREIEDNRPRHQNTPSQGFFIDILSDNNGISLHRFQNVVWTVIAMVIYVVEVYGITTGCALPELSQTLLLLTGISSATYVVLKANENTPGSDTDGQDGQDPNNGVPPAAPAPLYQGAGGAAVPPVMPPPVAPPPAFVPPVNVAPPPADAPPIDAPGADIPPAGDPASADGNPSS